MSRAASSASLQAGIARLRKKWSLPPMNRSASATSAASSPLVDHRRGEVAQQHQRAGPVAVVGLVAHLQHLGEDAGDVDRARAARTAACSSGPSTSAIQRSRVEHLGRVGAVAQHLAEPLVERAVRTRAGGGVLEHEHPHRRRDHAGHRADRAAVVARLEARRGAGLEERDRVLGVVDEALEGGAAHQRPAQRAGRAVPGDRRAGVQELARARARAPRRPGATSTSARAGRRASRCERPLVGVGRQRVGGDGREVGLGAGHRRPPVDPGHAGRLGGRPRRRAGRRRR